MLAILKTASINNVLFTFVSMHVTILHSHYTDERLVKTLLPYFFEKQKPLSHHMN